MIIVVRDDVEQAAAWRALEVINALRRREPGTVRPAFEDCPWIISRQPKPEYL